MSSTRIFVEKKKDYRLEAESLKKELNTNLQLGLKSLRLLNIYDLFGFSSDLLDKCRYSVFAEIVTDDVIEDLSMELKASKYIAVEYLPGQFDQRASSAIDCVHLIDPSAEVKIKSGKLIILDDEVDDGVLNKIRRYFINPVELREKDLSKLEEFVVAPICPVQVFDKFREIQSADELSQFCKDKSLAMSKEDLAMVVDYFRKEGRDPNETELRILDTYWSDHCRHTTFTTILDKIDVEQSFIKEDLDKSLELYLKMRKELNREDKDVCLMDMATIGARYLRHKGLLDDLEQSEENNACSIYVDVDNDGIVEKWLLMFKNETHNHPTEIEPFGGAATCLGGAIRDPLSGRAYVYQAMRISGSGNIWKKVSETIEGKLPQRVISKTAAHGYSAYGNQIGLATTFVKEIIHPGYEAKHLELGAVVGAVKAENVRRESPKPGDIVLLIGGKTGRDGIGGATGSSKEHTENSLETCGSQVQKGNAPEERMLQRLFRRPELTKLIKKSNDFGAGGVSVAIGELADSLDIYLDRIPTKYSGLNATDLAISESQERMSVVIEAKDKEEFLSYCEEENIELTHVADITDSQRMRMFYGGELVADLKRSFINTAGARRHVSAVISKVEDKEPFLPVDEDSLSIKERVFKSVTRPSVASQKGLVEMFDASIGRSTVLMPYGGILQSTPVQVSVQKLPTDGFTNTASIMAYGFDPYLSSWSPYHGAAYAVVSACAKIVAAGASYEKIRFSYQEYFEKMNKDNWGKPISALLGALKMQDALGLPSIGGKDSMSGSFEDLNVPPTLIAFGITTVDVNKVISPELKWEGNKLYLIKHEALDNRMPNTEQLKRNWNFVSEQIAQNNIVSAYAIGTEGLAEALAKMSFGNAFGINVDIEKDLLFAGTPGSIVVEAEQDLDFENAIYLGQVTSGEDGLLHINKAKINLFELMNADQEPYSSIYPISSEAKKTAIYPRGFNPKTAYKAKKSDLQYKGEAVEKPLVFIPVFPGTNCDYDTAKAFRAAGAETEFGVFRNLNKEAVNQSIKMMADKIAKCNILVLSGGFSVADEPDGSGKFIANVLNNTLVARQIEELLERGGLILGICNGFQALIKSGLLPYGKPNSVEENSPSLFKNDINRHISMMATTRLASTNSPWLAGMNIGDEHTIAVSHGEGKFVVSEELAKELFEKGQVAFQYVDPIEAAITMKSPSNPNGSFYAIEGIISPNGQILGKMGHTERYEEGLFKNIDGELYQPLFENAVKYFRKK